MARKWIVENSDIKLGNVEYHSELCKNREDVIGGGYFWFDTAKKKLFLYGKSEDFGVVKIENFKQLFDNFYFSCHFDGYDLYYAEGDIDSTAKIENYTLIGKIY